MQVEVMKEWFEDYLEDKYNCDFERYYGTAKRSVESGRVLCEEEEFAYSIPKLAVYCQDWEDYNVGNDLFFSGFQSDVVIRPPEMDGDTRELHDGGFDGDTWSRQRDFLESLSDREREEIDKRSSKYRYMNGSTTMIDCDWLKVNVGHGEEYVLDSKLVVG